MYAIKKPSPWQGGEHHQAAYTIRARHTSRPQRQDAERDHGARDTKPARQIDLSSANVKPNRRHPAPMRSIPDRSSCRCGAGSTRARRDPPARQRPLPQNSATRASPFVITAPGHSADRAEHYSWRGVATPRGSTQRELGRRI